MNFEDYYVRMYVCKMVQKSQNLADFRRAWGLDKVFAFILASVCFRN
jgi:hypothetical protein